MVREVLRDAQLPSSYVPCTLCCALAPRYPSNPLGEVCPQTHPLERHIGGLLFGINKYLQKVTRIENYHYENM